MNRETSEPSPYTAEWRANSPSRRLSDTLLLAPGPVPHPRLWRDPRRLPTL